MGSDMAAQIQARIAEDGGAGLTDPAATGGPPGSEGASGTQAPTPPAAGPSTTDTGAGQSPPDSIPYARFKEVNDRLQELRGYEDLQAIGYDPDSLGRLASFEVAYQQNPSGTVAQLIDNLDLPQETKDSIKESLGSGSAEGAPSGEPKPSHTELSPEDRRRLEYVDRMQEREAKADQDKRLAHVTSIWNRLDEADGIETPEYIKLVHIAAAANSGRTFETLEQLADEARKGVLDYRSTVLGAAVQRTGRGGSPPALPGSPPSPTGPVEFKDMRAASRAAEEAIKRGELPTIIPGA